MNNHRLNEGLQEFESTEALEQSLALVDIVKDLLDTTKKHLNKIYIILIVSILSNLVIIGAFLWYESNVSTSVETVTETTTTQSVDGENSRINNVDGDQYNDSATHNETTSE